jgi:hypothetical protein
MPNWKGNSTMTELTATTPRRSFGNFAPLAVLAAVATVALSSWGYYGFPDPDTFAHYNTAQQECVDFATKAKWANFTDTKPKPWQAFSQWMRHGRIVVEIGQLEDGRYMPRLCVVGGGQIEIVSGLENWEWR